jgi:hypothetical protein
MYIMRTIQTKFVTYIFFNIQTPYNNNNKMILKAIYKKLINNIKH